MTAPAPLYDLVLMLDPAAPEEERAKILTDVEAMISSAGTIENRQEWGTRTMIYEIRHKTDAEYHLLQFHGPAGLLADLQRMLRIADGVIRFRLIKLAPGTPPAPEPRAAPVAEAEAPSAA